MVLPLRLAAFSSEAALSLESKKISNVKTADDAMAEHPLNQAGPCSLDASSDNENDAIDALLL